MSKHNRSQEEVIRGYVLKDDPFLQAAYELTEREKVFCDEYLATLDERLAAYKAVNLTGQSKHPIENRDFWKREATKLFNIPRVKNYIDHHNKQAELKIGKPVTIESVVEVLGEIMYDNTAENKDRIKAGEVLLKHLNGFEKHNNSKAPKQLTIINQMSEEDTKLELEKAMKKIEHLKNNPTDQNDGVVEVEVID